MRPDVVLLLSILFISATSALVACDNGVEEDRPLHDVELYFENLNAATLDISEIREYAADASVNNIYLIPDEKFNWKTLQSEDLTDLRIFLQSRLDVSPKVKARGNFGFTPGIASQNEADSIWYAEQGWTINGPYIYVDPSEYPDTADVNLPDPSEVPDTVGSKATTHKK